MPVFRSVALPAPLRRTAVGGVLALSLICTAVQGAVADEGAYRLVNIPPQWRFESATPAYNPESGEKLGDFQRGIRVDVLEADSDAGKWRVRYVSFGSPDIEALIDWPDFARTYPHRWDSLKGELQQIPLLSQILGSHSPWPESLAQTALNYFGAQVQLEAGTAKAPERLITTNLDLATAWGMRPMSTAIEYGPNGRPIISIEFWNKAEGLLATRTFPGNSPHRAYQLLNEKLQYLSRGFEGHSLARADSAENTLALVRESRTSYPLANGTQALLRYQRNEYLILELRPFDPPQPAGRVQTSTGGAQEQNQPLADRLKANVTSHKDGYRYITSIPMISQGSKGYCVAATIARVLQYYGYHVDMHQMARLAETEMEGTSYSNMVSAMRRVCNSTPFRLRAVRSRDREELRRISIERGLPLVWLIPRHVRLVIGIDPGENGGIVYTDSWGPGHEFKTMPWGEFVNTTVDLFLLDLP